jgi:uncharacterized protein with von Willebrand factor type A (vWA) domain
MFPGVRSLDELVERLERQAAQLRSLLESLSPAERGELEALAEAALQDPGLRAALGELAGHLEGLAPGREAPGYRFQGEEPLSLRQALETMGQLRDLDRLEAELRAADARGDPGALDPESLRRLLGDEAADQLGQLERVARLLEEAGYLEQKGRRWELTPRAIRKIGQRALAEIFGQLRRDRVGRHATTGGGRRPADHGKPTTSAAFLLDLRRRSAAPPAQARVPSGSARRLRGLPHRAVDPVRHRRPPGHEPVHDLPGLLERRQEGRPGLDSLIRGQYPRDHLDVVGFSLYARRYAPEVLPTLRISERNVGTNMHHALLLARRLLAGHRGGNKQVIMVTDGEPTAHLEGDQAYFDYPTTRRTWELTRAEVGRCTREGITINTFMLEDSPGLMRFVDDMARINKGRALYVTPDRLGQYVLVDYVTGRQRRVG